MTQTQHTLESLSALSDVELDIEVAKAKRGPVPYATEVMLTVINRFKETPKYSTDANAALQLLDEMVDARFFDPTTVWSMHTQGTSIYEPDIPYRQEEHEIASANGKPSVALPRAITIAYILFKSQDA